MHKCRALFAPAVCALAISTAAHAKEFVEFSYSAEELSTQEARELLLQRIKTVSKSTCRSDSSVLMSRATIRRCADDLSGQLIKEIDDEKLTVLAESPAMSSYRTASR